MVKNTNSLARCRVATGPAGHPVACILRKELHPFMKPPLIQQPGLTVQKALHLTSDLSAHASSLLRAGLHRTTRRWDIRFAIGTPRCAAQPAARVPSAC